MNSACGLILLNPLDSQELNILGRWIPTLGPLVGPGIFMKTQRLTLLTPLESVVFGDDLFCIAGLAVADDHLELIPIEYSGVVAICPPTL